MSACAMLTYNNVSLTAWQTIKQAVKKHNIMITADSGNAGADGFTVHWNYDPTSQILSIQCTDSPFLVPCSTINSKINDEVEACLSQHDIAITHMVPT